MADLLRIRTVLSYGAGGPGLSTAYFRGTAFVPSAADLTDCAARVRAFWAAEAPDLDNGCSAAVQGDADIIDESTGALIGGLSIAPPAIVAGSGGASYLPPATQILVRLNTATIIGTRRLKGHVNVGRVTVTSSANGAPTVNVGTRATAAVAALLAGATGSVPVVWHRPKTAGSGNSGAIIGGSAAPFFAVLRSRRD